ncbi:hypothetical protein H0V99_03310 [Candidatus Saccharibacteria bacterium]|nr:hypothetical protein [Candidatus Saccharibacteria bacterium]
MLKYKIKDKSFILQPGRSRVPKENINSHWLLMPDDTPGVAVSASSRDRAI